MPPDFARVVPMGDRFTVFDPSVHPEQKLEPVHAAQDLTIIVNEGMSVRLGMLFTTSATVATDLQTASEGSQKYDADFISAVDVLFMFVARNVCQVPAVQVRPS